jgi:hypothetical protein
VQAARTAGDRELAAAVGRLRRPTLAAWAVNLLARERAGLLDQVTSLGEALRAAQDQLQGDELRALGRQRRQLVSAVTAEVRALADSAGRPLGEAAGRQVEETLHAALADPEAAAAVRSGLLTTPLASSGVESWADVVAVPGAGEAQSEPGPGAPGASGAAGRTAGRPPLTVVPDEGRALEEARARLAEVRRAVKEARRRRDKVERKREKAQARVLQGEAELAELRLQVAELEARTEEAAERVSELDAALEETATALEDARAEEQRAARRLADLDR